MGCAKLVVVLLTVALAQEFTSALELEELHEKLEDFGSRVKEDLQERLSQRLEDKLSEKYSQLSASTQQKLAEKRDELESLSRDDLLELYRGRNPYLPKKLLLLQAQLAAVIPLLVGQLGHRFDEKTLSEKLSEISSLSVDDLRAKGELLSEKFPLKADLLSEKFPLKADLLSEKLAGKRDELESLSRDDLLQLYRGRNPYLPKKLLLLQAQLAAVIPLLVGQLGHRFDEKTLSEKLSEISSLSIDDLRAKGELLSEKFPLKADLLSEKFPLKGDLLSEKFQLMRDLLSEKFPLKADLLSEKFPLKADLLSEKFPLKADLLSEKFPLKADLLSKKFPLKADLLSEKFSDLSEKFSDLSEKFSQKGDLLSEKFPLLETKLQEKLAELQARKSENLGQTRAIADCTAAVGDIVAQRQAIAGLIQQVITAETSVIGQLAQCFTQGGGGAANIGTCFTNIVNTLQKTAANITTQSQVIFGKIQTDVGKLTTCLST